MSRSRDKGILFPPRVSEIESMRSGLGKLILSRCHPINFFFIRGNTGLQSTTATQTVIPLHLSLSVIASGLSIVL